MIGNRTLLTIAKVFVILAACQCFAASRPVVISIPEDRDALEFVGQFNNTATTSQQFGYLSNIVGLSPIFVGEPQDETTCLFTFVTNATTDRTIVNGAFKIINRTGTTTVYLNTPPSDFTDPATFSQGTPIQVSSYAQQVVLNTQNNSFVTVHTNTITSVEPFSLNGTTYQLGEVGRSFRTTYLGQVNTTGAPSGWFGGHAVGAKK